MLTINGYDLRGELVSSEGVGVFTILSPARDMVTRIAPYFELRRTSGEVRATDEDHEKLAADVIKDALDDDDSVIISLEPEHRSAMIKISLLTVRDRIQSYQPDDYKRVISEFIEEQHLPRLDRGALLMKNELDDISTGVCATLIQALDHSIDSLFTEYVKMLKRFDPTHGQAFEEHVTLGQFTRLSVTQLAYTDQYGEYLTSLLKAGWIKPIIESLWCGEICARADKTPKLQRNVPEMFLELGKAVPASLLNQESTILEVKQDRIWLEFNGDITAGLTPEIVEMVLKQHNQGLIIDLLKLFTTLWNERPQIQRSGRFNIDGRWQGLVELLHDRYGTATGGDSTMKVINSCRLLEALRWGENWADHEKLISFGGRKRNEQLIVTYLEGFTEPLRKHERLIPIIQHPKGATRSRALYNRFGLALGSWLVDHSINYHFNGGAGVEFNKDAYRYFRSAVGFQRNSDVDKALNAFEDFGAITRQDGLLDLGEINGEGKQLILEGARRSVDGRKRRMKQLAGRKNWMK